MSDIKQDRIQVRVRDASLAMDSTDTKVIKIEFSFSLDMLEKVRSIPGRRYHAAYRCWSAPLFPETIKQLIAWGFTLDDALQKIYDEGLNRTHLLTGTLTIPGLGGVLRNFQKEGVAFIDSHNGRALIADEMGLGKTIQALAWMQLHPEFRPAVIVVPAGVKYNWAREAMHWLSKPDVQILSGTSVSVRLTKDIIIINYDILPKWIEAIKSLNPMLLVLDEVQYIKSGRAKRTKATKKLGKGIPYLIGLSGTPIVNRPIEGYNFFNMLDPTLFSNYVAYTKRYCNAHHTRFGMDVSGASHKEELHAILTGSYMLRRLKADVMPELPDKVRSFVPISLSNEQEYRAAEANFIAFLRKTKGEEAAAKASTAEKLVQTEGLKQLAAHGKLPEAIEWITDFLMTEEKLVVFAMHKSIINALMQKFGHKAVKIDGTVDAKDRQHAVDRFQNDPKVRLFIGNIKAAGVGITLTAASNVAFLELPWTPGDMIQAEDRCHRIGQKESVNIYFLLAKDTIDEKIASILDNKRKVLEAVLDGREVTEYSLLDELINSYQDEQTVN